MSEEAFQILFDIMERHFAALKIPDSEPDVRLTRASSYSGSPTTRRILIEQCYRNNDSVNLVRQYSCEQIFDQTTRTSQVKFSEVVRTDNDESVKTWGSAARYRRDSLEKPDWSSDSRSDGVAPPSVLANNASNDRGVEYMEVENLESTNRRSTFAVPTTASTHTAVSLGRQSLSLLSSETPARHPIAPERKIEPPRKRRSRNYQEIKDKIRPLVAMCPTRATTERSSRSCFELLFFVLLATTLLLAAMVLQEAPRHKHSTDFVDAVVELNRRIYGQDRAVAELSEYLQLDAPISKVVALVGGTGVGKSYTVEIIKSNFPRAHCVRQYFPPIEVTASDVCLAFLYAKLIILENLKEHDLTGVVNFLRTCRDTADRQYITVLAVFNVERMDDDSTRSVNLTRSLEAIRQSFVDEDIDAKIVAYDSLSDDALEKCIADAANDSGLRLSDSQIDLVKRNLLINKSGCKGAHSKVQVIGRQ